MGNKVFLMTQKINSDNLMPKPYLIALKFILNYQALTCQWGSYKRLGVSPSLPESKIFPSR
jgi:hypothetical protein